jgi:hypothetical protein
VRVRATGKAVPLPEPGDIKGDPGPLPRPARLTSSYFEVRKALLLPRPRRTAEQLALVCM